MASATKETNSEGHLRPSSIPHTTEVTCVHDEFDEGDYWGFITTKLNPYDAKWNHLCVQITDKRPGYHKLEEIQVTYFTEQFKVALEYWGMYAKLKKKAGVIFEIECNSDDVRNFFKQQVTKELTMEELKLLKVNTSEYEGGLISDELKGKVGKFGEVRKVVMQVMQEEPLLSFENTICSVDNLFEGFIDYHFCGEQLRVSVSEDYQFLRISNRKGNEVIEENVEIKKESILNYLLKIKKMNGLKNLMNAPKKGTRDFLRRAFLVDDDVVDSSFEKFEGILGSWEAVEEFSNNALKQYLNKDIDVKVFETVKIVSEREMQIHKYKHHEQYYYVINASNEDREFEIDLMVFEKEYPRRISELIGQFYLPKHIQ